MRALFVTLAFGLILIPALASAQNYKDVAPQTPPTRPAPAAPAPPLPTALPTGAAANKVIIPAVKGLVFVPGVEKVVKTGSRAKGVAIDATLTLLDDPSFRDAVTPFLGKPLTFAKLTELTREVVKQYRAKDHPLVDVIVPEQDVNNGVVQLAVVEFTVGKVRVEGNKWFSSDLLTNEVRLKSGDHVVGSRLLVDQTVLNENQFRTVEVLYERGTQAGQTDIVLKTQDRFPLRVYAGFDDAGVQSLGIDRYNTGFNLGNVFGLDHQLSYQFTASSDILTGNPDTPGRPNDPRFVSHSFNYTMPVPWTADKFSVFGLHAQSVPILANSFNQIGLTDQLSTRYIMRLPMTEKFTQELRLGTDFKSTNNNLAFGGINVNNTTTEVDQLVAQYNATLLDPVGSTALTGTFYYSPGGLSPQNNDTAFETSRVGASSTYTYGQAVVERLTPLPKLGALPDGFVWSIKGTLQHSDAALLASEQLSLGGVGSVRGYDPYTVQGDNGWLLSNELRGPVFNPAEFMHIKTPWDGRMQLFLFNDVGHVSSIIPQQTQPLNATLSSVGAGLHYTIDRYLDVRFDWGWQLAHIPGGPSTLGSRGDIAIVASY